MPGAAKYFIKPKAFTLVELLVVISIIAVLLALLMPSLQRARNQAKKVMCLSNVHQLSLGVYAYSTAYNGSVPCDYAWRNYGYLSLWSESLVYYNVWTGTGLLYRPTDKMRANGIGQKGYIQDPKVFYCPAFLGTSSLVLRSATYDYYAKLGAFVEPSKSSYMIYAPYRYRPIYVDKSYKYTNGWKLADNSRIAVVSDFVYDPLVGGIMQRDGHGTAGINAGYADGHANWVADPKIYERWGKNPIGVGMNGVASLDVWSILDSHN